MALSVATGAVAAFVAIAALRRGFGAAVSFASLAADLEEDFARAEAFAGVFADDLAVLFLGVSSGGVGTGRGSE
ncbi:MAG: hypothetical protein ACJ79A_02125 [Gemmatimonadaceae bacterium]